MNKISLTPKKVTRQEVDQIEECFCEGTVTEVIEQVADLVLLLMRSEPTEFIFYGVEAQPFTGFVTNVSNEGLTLRAEK